MKKNNAKKESLRRFAKFLCLAQAASDSGKGCTAQGLTSANAVEAGYGLKDLYIRQAVAEVERGQLHGTVKVSWGGDFMFIVYFDIVGFGQVSFHSPHPLRKYQRLPVGVWTRRIGESYETCRKLNKELNLQVW